MRHIRGLFVFGALHRNVRTSAPEKMVMTSAKIEQNIFPARLMQITKNKQVSELK